MSNKTSSLRVFGVGLTLIIFLMGLLLKELGSSMMELGLTA